MENGDSNYADSGAAADNSCGCEGCEQAWREAWALKRIQAAERDCGALPDGMKIDLLQDQSADILCFDLDRDASALLVQAAEGLALRLARYETERRLEEAEGDATRLRIKVAEEVRLEQDHRPRYAHPTCTR